MDSQCEVTNAGDHIRVRIGNPVTVETVDACAAQAVRMASEITIDGRAAFLVDFRGTFNQDSYSRTFWYIREEFSRHKLLKSSRIALLVDASEPTYAFVETTAQNAGFVVQRFADEPSAMEWLTPNLAKQPTDRPELEARS